MKYFGSCFEYEKERNEDLMRAYHQQIRMRKQIDLPDVFRAIVEMPSNRFWVSEERAAIVMARMMKGDRLTSMRPTKREMFYEIFKRVMELKKEYPSMSVFELTFRTVRQPAPKFYITCGSAKVIIYKIKKQWYNTRMQKLRHLR